jgi:hypothetical protein
VAGVNDQVQLLVPSIGYSILPYFAIMLAVGIYHRGRAVSETDSKPTNPIEGLPWLLPFLGALLLVAAVFALVWLTIGYSEAAVWASLTWLASHGLLLAWLPRGSARPALWTSWTLACVAVYFTLWCPSYDGPHSAWGAAIGYVDRHYWPYEGKSKCSVTLTPKEKTFRRITITNDRVVSGVNGYQGKILNYTGLVRRELREIDDYSIHMVGLKEEKGTFVIHAKQGFAWQAVSESGNTRTGEGAPALEDLVQWMRECGAQSTDDKILQIQTKTWWNVLLKAEASTDFVAFGWRGDREPVGYLEWISANEETLCKDPNDYPYGERLGTWNNRYAPAVAILYVGVPVMLAVWLLGLFLLTRSAQPTRTWADWWRGLPKFVHIAISIPLALLYLTCLVLFFGYSVSSSISPTDPAKQEHRFSVGHPTPWFTHYSKSDGFGSSIQFLAWSNLAAIIRSSTLPLDRPDRLTTCANGPPGGRGMG